MNTALEYFFRAAECERLAKEADSDAKRVALQSAAQKLRTLGNQAKASETVPDDDQAPGSPKASD